MIPDPGAFGAVRKHDIHTGVDIHLPEGTHIYCIKSGTVLRTEWFTGPNSIPPTPWWLPTRAVWVMHADGTVAVYGEIVETVLEAQRVQAGDLLGIVMRVLPVYKGKPTSMLHFELYACPPNETVVWELGEPQPDGLLDPTQFLEEHWSTYNAHMLY